MTLTPFFHDSAYRGISVIDDRGREISHASTGEYLRDLAVCFHVLRENGFKAEPLPIEVMAEVPKRPAVTSSETIP